MEQTRKASGGDAARAGADRRPDAQPPAVSRPTLPGIVLLRVDTLAKVYRDRKVVDGVSFEVNHGEIVGLLGPNGAGKTTSFKMTMGMVEPDGGRILLEGEDITRLPMYRRARKGIGYLAQERSTFQRLTVRENLLAVLETQGHDSATRKRIADDLIAEFGLVKVVDQLAYTLSGGETRRLEIARALTTEPKLLLLDEPFSGVDPIAVAEIQEIIRRLRQGRGIGTLLTDHNVRETLSVTDRSYIIDTGRILAQGRPEEIVANPLVRKVYLGEHFTM